MSLLEWPLHAPGFFAIVLFMCDNFLKIKERKKGPEVGEELDEENEEEEQEQEQKEEHEEEEEEFQGQEQEEVREEDRNIQRFLKMAIQLPMELQMLLMNRTQGSSSVFISLSDREAALISLASEFVDF